MNRTLPLALAAALALLPGCRKESAPSTSSKNASRAFPVGVETVAARSVEYAVESVGSVEAYDVVEVPARVAGTLESLAFDEGDVVTPEQVLAVVDGRRYELEKEQAAAFLGRIAAAVESAAARTLQAEAALREAETSLARRRGLREKNPGWVTEDELSTLETSVERAKASVEEARAGEKVAAAQVEEARSALALAEKDAADARVRSPIAGVIERRLVSPGQYVKVGDSLATLVDTTRLRVRFRVSETESVRLFKGQPVEFRTAAFPGRDFRATVFHVNATADPVTRMVECLASVEDREPGLRPGFFASVRSVISREGKVVVIPVQAILPTEGGFTAFAVVDGKAVRKRLKLGLHTKDGGVEVLDGLAEGEVIAVAGAGALEDGVPVQADGGAPAGPAPAPAGAEGK